MCCARCGTARGRAQNGDRVVRRSQRLYGADGRSRSGQGARDFRPRAQLVIDAVSRYDGYIVQYFGNDILALFGARFTFETMRNARCMRP